MKPFDPKSLFLLSDRQLANAGRILGDTDIFPVLYVLKSLDAPMSAAQLAHELGAGVTFLQPILDQLISDGLVSRRGRAYQSNRVADVVVDFVKEIVKDVSLDGTETSCNSSLTLTAGPGGREDVAIGPAAALTNNHTLVDFSASALVLSRRVSVERQGATQTSTASSLTIDGEDEQTANNEASDYLDL
jgi:hypothetical protein